MRDRRLILGLVLVAAAIALWLWQRDDATSLAPGPVGEGEAGPAPQLDAGAAPRSADSPDATGTGAADVPAVARRFTVRGRVLLPHGRPAAGARVTAQAHLLSYEEAPSPPAATAAADGTYALDLSASFDLEGEHVVGIAVQASHPRYRAATEVVRVTGMDRTGSGRAFEVDVALSAAAVVTGLLVDEAGEPLPGAWARLYRLIDGRVKQALGSQRFATADEDGRFRIAHAREGRFLLVANAAGRAPAAREVDVFLDRTTEVDPLLLPRGAVLAGRLSARGEPLPGMHVVARRRWVRGTDSLLVGQGDTPHEVHWTGGRARAGTKSSPTDADGRFRITGLAPGEHALRLRAIIGRRAGVAVHFDLLQDVLKPRFEAPREDCVLDLDGAWCHVRVVDPGGRPVPTFGVSFGSHGVALDERGEAHMLLPAEAAYRLRIRPRRLWASQEVEIRTGPAGSDQDVLFTLRPLAAGPTLRVVLEGPHADRIDVAGIGLFRSPTDRRTAHDATLRGKPGMLDWHRAPRGSWVAELRPDGPWRGGRGYYRPVRVPVEIAPEGTTTLRAPLVRGGRIDVEARDPDGNRLPARCRIEDAEGLRVPVFFMGRDAFSGSGGSGGLSGTGPSTVDPALPPGRYTLSFSGRGYRPLREAVTVVAGQTTAVRVTLVREE